MGRYGNNNLLVSSLVNPTVVASSGSSASALSQAYQDLLDETSQYDKLNIIPCMCARLLPWSCLPGLRLTSTLVFRFCAQ